MARRKRIYYPEGSIQKGLYTSGQEWMFENGQEYQGQYHTYTNTKEVFTESYFIKDVSQKLIPYYNLNVDYQKNTFQYNVLKEIYFNKLSINKVIKDLGTSGFNSVKN